jgi:biopolymer transport protein ExbB
VNEPVQLGFAHFLAQADGVARTLLLILLAMSVVSWALIALKAATQFVRRRRSERFLDRFWNSGSLAEVQRELGARGAREPFARLTSEALQAQAHHARYAASRLAEAGSAEAFLTRTIKKVLDEQTMRLDAGLSTLATIGATAPFVGLFGTVWGVYHALVAIGIRGAVTLDKVAGPVGEALIRTGIGLAVAIPAVVGYNAITRANRVLVARLDAFAYELFTFLTTGRPLERDDAPDESPQRTGRDDVSLLTPAMHG